MKKYFAIAIVIIGLLIFFLLPEKELTHPPGILVPENPIQNNLSVEKKWQKGEFNFEALAEFKIKGLVLSTNFFWSGKETEISPVDLALGWGPMSDQKNLDKIDISQRNRWYYWKTDSFPISRNEISINSANMHIIPADEVIEEKLDQVYKGCIIQIKGYLVEVRTNDGWRWKSSLKRDDTGGGSCELVWVDEFEILDGI